MVSSIGLSVLHQKPNFRSYLPSHDPELLMYIPSDCTGPGNMPADPLPQSQEMATSSQRIQLTNPVTLGHRLY